MAITRTKKLDLKKLVGKQDLNLPVTLFTKKTPVVKVNEVESYGGQIISKNFILKEVKNGYYRDSLVLTILGKSTKFKPVVIYIKKDARVGQLLGKAAEKVFTDQENNNVEIMETLLHHGFTIGSDPEIFVEDEKGEVIPAFNFLGSKAEPSAGGFENHTTSNGMIRSQPIYWDGFQAEFETTPHGCLESHTRSVWNGLRGLYNLAKAHNKNAKLSLKTVMRIPDKMLEEAKDEHVGLGCAPSLNVYGHKGKVVPNPRTLPFRPAGGHIHFGCGKLTAEETTNVVKALDAILGVACVALFQSYDNPVRREYYGLAGEYRLPKHGLEYRTLSNAWLSHPLIMNMVFDLSRKAFMFSKLGFMKYWDAKEKEVVRIINECDVKGAQKMMKNNKKLYLKLFHAAYGNRDNQDKLFESIFNIFYNGLETVVDEPTNIEKNWSITDGATRIVTADKNVNYAHTKIIGGKKVA